MKFKTFDACTTNAPRRAGLFEVRLMTREKYEWFLMNVALPIAILRLVLAVYLELT